MAVIDILLAGHYRSVAVAITISSHWPPYANQKEQGGKHAVGGLITRHELTWDEVVVRLEHAAGEVFGDRFRLEMKVAKHSIGAPTSQELDDICVDFGDKQRHSASRTKRTG